MRQFLCAVSVVSVLVFGAIGCGQPGGGGGGSGPAGAASQVRQIDTEGLPKLGSPMAPLDEGRLEVAPPANWHVPPRRSQWLARFQADPGSPYPTIFITAEHSDATFHVTRDNLEQFANTVRNELLADSGTSRLAAGVQPVEVGGFHGTLYRRWGKSGTRVMERWMLETVANGRRYTLELRAREGLADEYLPQLYAVASGLEFHKGEDSGSGVTGIEAAPDEESGDEDSNDDDADEDTEDDAGGAEAP